MRSMWDVIVVGTGIMGAAALASLAAAGQKVLGIDRFEPPHDRGSSHGETRVTRKAYFEDPRYVPLLVRSFQRYRSLEQEVGRPLFEPTPGLHFGPAPHQGMRGVLAAVTEHALPHGQLSATEVRARFAVHPADDDACLVEDEAGVLATEPMVAAFLRVAERDGATRLSGARVVSIERRGASLAIRTEHPGRGSETFVAPRVVLATGGWTAASELLPPPAPLRVERQVQLWFRPEDPEPFSSDRFPIFLRFGEPTAFYGIPIVPRFGGLSAEAVKVCAHHGGRETSAEDLERTVDAEDEARVIDFVRTYLPQLGTRIVERRVCMYTNTPDENFVIGPHPEEPRVIVACGFSGHGFKLAPAVGELVRELVIDGAAPHPLFDPQRFTRA